MNTTVIVMLVIGAVLAAAGFIMPGKREAKADTRKDEERFREFCEQQMKGAKSRIGDATDESVQYAIEKTERALDRLTNEKMLAVNEYSDTVLKEINKSHEEVMFLYDMLNDKQKQIKLTAAQVEKTAKAAQETAQDAKLMAEQSAESILESMQAEKAGGVEKTTQIPAEKQTKRTQPAKAERGIDGPEESAEAKPGTAKAAASKKAAAKPAAAKSQRSKKTPSAAAAAKESQTDNIQIQFAANDGQAQNNNVRILELHKKGKSNMAIAKELGLGIGEVKLVIDLFEGM